VGMTICGVILMVRGRRLLAAGGTLATVDDHYRSARGAFSVIAILGAIAFYIAASHALGFVITGFIVVSFLLWWFNVGLARALLIALTAVLAVDWFFGWMFRVPLPLGILPNGPANILMNFIRGR
jgi:hypothetical protein